MAVTPVPTVRYLPRVLKFEEMISHGYWRMKLYSVTIPEVEKEARAPALDFLGGLIDQITKPMGQHGYGVAILHQTRELEFMTVLSWENGNEMALHMWQRKRGLSRWRSIPVSLCPWDTYIIAYEAELWRTHVLQSQDIEGYLSRRFSLQTL
jgi:hypothetical protein